MLFFFIGFLMMHCLSGQHYFNKTYGPDPQRLYTSGRLVETPSGFLLIGHRSAVYGVDLYVTQLDAEGEEIGTTIIDSGPITGWEKANTAIGTFDGNYVFYSNTRTDSASRVTRLHKISEEGQLLWTKSYYCPELYCARPVAQIIETSDHDLVWTGSYREENELGQTISTTSAWIMKTNHLGEVIWESIEAEPHYAVPGKNYGQFGRSLLELPNGNILLAGAAYELVGNAQAFGTQKVVLREFDSDTGEVLEEQVFDTWSYQSYPSMTAYDEEHFLLSMYGPDEDSEFVEDVQWGIAKISYEGDVVWEMLHPNILAPDSFYLFRTPLTTSLVTKDDGGFLAAFQYDDWYWIDGFPNTGWRTMIAEFAADGAWLGSTPLYKDQSIVTHVYGNRTAGYYDFIYDLDRCSDGGYIATGTRHGGPEVPHKCWVVKLDSELNQCMAMECDSTADGTLVWQGREESVQMNAYPNPTRDQLTLDFSDPLTDAGILRVYNLEGQLLKEQPVPAGSTGQKISLGSNGSGLYLWELRSRGIMIQKGKTIVE